MKYTTLDNILLSITKGKRRRAMKQLGVLVLVGIVLVAVSVAAEEGGAVFESQRCSTCHKPDSSTANPSLKEIAQVYHGKEDQLINYLKGEAKPIVNMGKANMMKRALEKTKALSDADRKALAGFIMGHE
jgi:cytochrome c551/c552